ncbi:unnamed protein product [Ranitomeya imitator]|uniref:BHLH domain-containing protein n=1 Tax=Ranitomeya imitator TaxID=111125 RepID=A0ABN9LFI5_9NEOB|nr:unnamed protein product [Ranitomeya imitator]
MPQDCSFLPDWVYHSSGSQSPASSLESYITSPNYSHSSIHCKTNSNYLQDPVMNMDDHQAEKSTMTSKRTRCKMIGPQRQNASEREKLRMRNLSKALHNLRRYLPPSVVPAGRNLTKIETLRLTISYISHLSQILGLNEETMGQKRETQPDTNATYPKIPEGYQEVTCRHYQQIQQPLQSPVCNELSYQCNNFRISSTQYNTRQQEEQLMSSSVNQRRNIPAIDCSLTSPYTSRLTHTVYQVTDNQAVNLHSHLPYQRENDSCLKNSDPQIRVGRSEDMKCGSQAEKWSRKWVGEPGGRYMTATLRERGRKSLMVWTSKEGNESDGTGGMTWKVPSGKAKSLPKLEDRWVQPGPAAWKESPNQGFKLEEANLHIPGAFWESEESP